MANPIASSKHHFLLKVAITIIFLYVVNGGDAKQGVFHNIKISSLLPDSVCHSSSQGKLLSSSLRVVHKYGPCHKSKITESPSVSQVLTQDEKRVDSINSRIAAGNTFGSSKSVTFPAKSGYSFLTGDYVATVGLGTPKKDLSLILDTGSDLTWTQCKPCAGSCHKQQEEIFDPSLSSSYSNITCNNPLCNQLKSATGFSPLCSVTTCVYRIQYIGQSFSAGYFAKETLTLSPKEVVSDFLFGCGQYNGNISDETAGLIGLGRDKLSLVSQTASKYGNFFSYCLPSQSGTGYLTLGKSDVSNTVKYIPFASSQGTNFYFIDILEIYVDGQKLPISPTVFSTTGSIIDSGTVITRLPPAAYTALRDTFRQLMSKYPLGQPTDLFDTCYDLSNYESVQIPNIGFLFGGNNMVDIDTSGILVGLSLSQVCLAFAPNNNAADVAIFGNFQQKTMQVVYDVAGGKLGFGKNGCA